MTPIERPKRPLPHQEDLVHLLVRRQNESEVVALLHDLLDLMDWAAYAAQDVLPNTVTTLDLVRSQIEADLGARYVRQARKANT